MISNFLMTDLFCSTSIQKLNQAHNGLGVAQKTVNNTIIWKIPFKRFTFVSMILKRVISLLILTLYLHGMSGYTMSFHKCMITGFENVYTGYGVGDPCGEEEKDCHETGPHFEQADCCDIDQTIVSIDDDSNISYFKSQLSTPSITYTLIQTYLLSNSITTHHFYAASYTIRPPEPYSICVFRI